MTNKGNLLISSFFLITALLYVYSKPTGFSFTSSPWSTSAQFSALLAAVFLSLNYILAARLRLFEWIFGGLDNLYKFHHYLGAAAFVLMINHPLALVVNALPNLETARRYVILGNNLAYNLGILSLYLFISVLAFTFLIKLPYQTWLTTHRLIGIPLIFVISHSLLISSDISTYLPLRIWIISLLVFALASNLYKQFLYHHLGPKFLYKLDHQKYLRDITECYLLPQGKIINFSPGQYVFAKFLGAKTPESHPYTVSSPPSSKLLRLSVKTLGDHTLTIKDIKPNSFVELIGPYGNFGNRFFGKQDVICVAGGIGITPFLSLIMSESESPKTRQITLFYCTKNKSEAIYLSHLQKLNLKNLKVIPYYSSEKGYLKAVNIKDQTINFDQSLFFICGPTKLMNDITTQLRTLGVKSRDIIFEDFKFI